MHTYKLTDVICKSHCHECPEQLVISSCGTTCHLIVGSQGRVRRMSQFSSNFMLLCCVTRNVNKGLLMVRPSLPGEVQVMSVQT